MAETLLSSSGILIFGRKVEDLLVIEPITFKGNDPKRSVSVATVAAIADITAPIDSIDGIPLSKGMSVLVKNNAINQNGIYRVNREKKLKRRIVPPTDKKWIVKILNGTLNSSYYTIDHNGNVSTPSIERDSNHNPFIEKRSGLASQLEQQLLLDEDPVFARIYGFSFEGLYYDLGRPVLFLVHGEGTPASDVRVGAYDRPNVARAPGDPSRTGIGSADFQFSDDIMVWSYDKADYTIRMDVETGMFEDVLLGAMFGGGPGGMDTAGMNARGMNARGMNARGMNARGMNARGMNARGGGNSD